MKNTYFFTGYPGFIASSLVQQLLLEQKKINRIYLLVLPSMKECAEKELNKLVISEKIPRSLFTIVMGDITKQGLGLTEKLLVELRLGVTHVFHLAAIYDLAVKKEVATQVNVKGTQHVNDWVCTLSSLKRYIYFSTAYVSGCRQGKILETELNVGQSFKNYYEETKYQAEVLVEKLKEQVPLTIIRPGIVRGHSITGETNKFDGPYFILNFLDRMQFLPRIPFLGSGEGIGNFVPVDYIFQATLYLAHAEGTEGKTYHLTDPCPYSMKEVYIMMMEEYIGKKPFGTVPLFVSKGILSVPMTERLMGVEKEALDYFSFHVDYDTTQAEEALADSGITCPNFKETITPMVDFYRQYRTDPQKQISSLRPH